MAGDVFVSYSRKDRDRVRPLVQRLQTADLPVWIDERGIDGASLWGQEIVEAIEGCTALILMLSRSSLASDHVLKEVALASEGKKPILPLLLEPVTLPKAFRYHLAGIQQIELFRGDSEERFRAVLRALSRVGCKGGEMSSGAPTTPAPEPREKELFTQDSGAHGRLEPSAASHSRSAPRGDAARLAAHPAPPSVGTQAKPSGAAVRVALLYKRNVQPDERLLKVLETRLREHGHEVFVDRHLTIGVEWPQEIERQIRSADAVIPLLSARSIDSEMLQWELQIANEAAREQHGTPRLLPVRLNDLKAEELVPIVGRLQHATWKGPEDDEGVFDELMGALQRPPTAPAALPPPGGAMPLDCPYYVARPADPQFHAAVARKESIVLIKGARQMGKTSLLARGLQQARKAGFRDIHTDLQSLDPADFESPEALFKALATSLAEGLELDALPHQVWDARQGPSSNFRRYMRRDVLRSIQTHLVWAIDESDRLLECDFGSQVFGLFRTWHNDRALDPTGPWASLTLVIAYATEAHLFIKEVYQSPFNVGLRLTLQDFTLDQVRDLNDRYRGPLRSRAEVERFHRLVGGHPYLVTRGFREMVDQGLTISTLEAEGDRNDGIFGDHLRRMLVVLARNPALCEVVRGVLRGQPCPTEESFYRLWSAGIMAGESAQDLRPRCQLYASYLKRQLP
jgi:AAA domain-containing protein/TIR domain-containing protein